jgi:hypothetical protein
VAQDISSASPTLDRQRDIGELKLKISGCINACGHHHVGHIGILGVEKKGAELYQVTLGGSADEHASPSARSSAAASARRDHRRHRDDRRDLSRPPPRPFGVLPRRLSPPWRRRRSRRRSMLAKPKPLEAANEVAIEAAALDARYGGPVAAGVIAFGAAIGRFRGGIAAVSSFGADSAVLLHMIVARSIPGCR